MKKMIWALIFGAIAVLPAHAEDLAIPAASGNDAADSSTNNLRPCVPLYR